MSNLLIIILLILLSVYLIFYLNEDIENFLEEIQIRDAIAEALAITKRRVVDIVYIGNLNDDSLKITFNILPRNDIELLESSVIDTLDNIRKKLDNDQFIVYINNKSVLLKSNNLDLSNIVESISQNNERQYFGNTEEIGENSEYENLELEKHKKYIKSVENIPVSHNLDRYLTIDTDTNTLIEPDPIIIQQEEELFN